MIAAATVGNLSRGRRVARCRAAGRSRRIVRAAKPAGGRCSGSRTSSCAAVRVWSSTCARHAAHFSRCAVASARSRPVRAPSASVGGHLAQMASRADQSNGPLLRAGHFAVTVGRPALAVAAPVALTARGLLGSHSATIPVSRGLWLSSGLTRLGGEDLPSPEGSAEQRANDATPMWNSADGRLRCGPGAVEVGLIDRAVTAPASTATAASTPTPAAITPRHVPATRTRLPNPPPCDMPSPRNSARRKPDEQRCNSPGETEDDVLARVREFIEHGTSPGVRGLWSPPLFSVSV